MTGRKRERSFNQNQLSADEVVKSRFRLSFFNKLRQRFSAKVGGAAILALIVLHFVSQFIFFQNENAPNEITPPEIENKQIVEIKPESEPAKPSYVTTPEPVTAPRSAPQERKPAPSPKVTKKKLPRESKAERLRRTEKILTGV
ncbi:MAG: hypothetical protein M3209_13585 [Acidobacteriota bacterium]|nr:hypothetical protein [Acidobacteriota bacterium]